MLVNHDLANKVYNNAEFLFPVAEYFSLDNLRSNKAFHAIASVNTCYRSGNDNESLKSTIDAIEKAINEDYLSESVKGNEIVSPHEFFQEFKTLPQEFQDFVVNTKKIINDSQIEPEVREKTLVKLQEIIKLDIKEEQLSEVSDSIRSTYRKLENNRENIDGSELRTLLQFVFVKEPNTHNEHLLDHASFLFPAEKYFSTEILLKNKSFNAFYTARNLCAKEILRRKRNDIILIQFSINEIFYSMCKMVIDVTKLQEYEEPTIINVKVPRKINYMIPNESAPSNKDLFELISKKEFLEDFNKLPDKFQEFVKRSFRELTLSKIISEYDVTKVEQTPFWKIIRANRSLLCHCCDPIKKFNLTELENSIDGIIAVITDQTRNNLPIYKDESVESISIVNFTEIWRAFRRTHPDHSESIKAIMKSITNPSESDVRQDFVSVIQGVTSIILRVFYSSAIQAQPGDQIASKQQEEELIRKFLRKLILFEASMKDLESSNLNPLRKHLFYCSSFLNATVVKNSDKDLTRNHQFIKMIDSKEQFKEPQCSIKDIIELIKKSDDKTTAFNDIENEEFSNCLFLFPLFGYLSSVDKKSQLLQVVKKLKERLVEAVNKMPNADLSESMQRVMTLRHVIMNGNDESNEILQFQELQGNNHLIEEIKKYQENIKEIIKQQERITPLKYSIFFDAAYSQFKKVDQKPKLFQHIKKYRNLLGYQWLSVISFGELISTNSHNPILPNEFVQKWKSFCADHPQEVDYIQHFLSVSIDWLDINQEPKEYLSKLKKIFQMRLRDDDIFKVIHTNRVLLVHHYHRMNERSLHLLLRSIVTILKILNADFGREKMDNIKKHLEEGMKKYGEILPINEIITTTEIQIPFDVNEALSKLDKESSQLKTMSKSDFVKKFKLLEKRHRSYANRLYENVYYLMSSRDKAAVDISGFEFVYIDDRISHWNPSEIINVV